MTCLLEGTRPMLLEVQGLAAKAGFGTPQRVSTGYDGRRLALLLAVLDKRAGLSFGQLDVFLNVVGGVRMQEPAGDLAVAAALASSVYDRALPADAVFIGEVHFVAAAPFAAGRELSLADCTLLPSFAILRKTAFRAHGLADQTEGDGSLGRLWRAMQTDTLTSAFLAEYSAALDAFLKALAAKK